jgi:CheY-like chemotaxis protein
VANNKFTLTIGGDMEQSEELVTGQTGDDNKVQLCIEDLEKEAFERGLPEKGNVLFGSGNHEVLNHRSHLQRISGQGEPVGTSPVILLIDDEEPFRSVLRQVLRNAGYDVVEASNGAEGIKYFYEKPADMIITDIIMPEKEGIETIIELKNAYPDVKLIAMSGGGWYGTDIDFDMAKKLGAHTLNKPFALQELLDVVNELLN